MALKVFIDSDVIISSLLSQDGAAFFLLNHTDDIEFFVSNISIKELERVSQRVGISLEQLKALIDTRFSKTELSQTIEELKEEFREYVLDLDDAHIVGGAINTNAMFLITYNTRHFKIDKLREDFNIILTTPANFLQYLRSR